jgi:hypothetical protein
VATILRTISPALDTAASQEAWTRLHDDRIDTRRALLRREPWTVSITHVSTRITWTVRPALFLPLAHRQGLELPACAHNFKPCLSERVTQRPRTKHRGHQVQGIAAPPGQRRFVLTRRLDRGGGSPRATPLPGSLPRGWGGRLRDFSQPLWREPRRSWPQHRALTGRSTDCPTRHELTGP